MLIRMGRRTRRMVVGSLLACVLFFCTPRERFFFDKKHCKRKYQRNDKYNDNPVPPNFKINLHGKCDRSNGPREQTTLLPQAPLPIKSLLLPPFLDA